MYCASGSAASSSAPAAFGMTSSNPAGAISRAISATSADGGTRTILGALLELMRLASVAMLAVRTGIAKRR